MQILHDFRRTRGFHLGQFYLFNDTPRIRYIDNNAHQQASENRVFVLFLARRDAEQTYKLILMWCVCVCV